MKKQNIVMCMAAAAISLSFGCGDDGSQKKAPCSECGANQVCSQGGICYDNPDCAACGADEVCVGGACYGKDSACAACDPDGVCVGGACLDKDSACAKCAQTQVCKNGKCYDATDPCIACGADQVCVGGECYEKTDPCAKCAQTQICKNDKCFAADDPCAQCAKDQVCAQKKCYGAGDDCIPGCSDSQLCLDGECRDCSAMCGEECCAEGQICDSIDDVCGDPCGGGEPRCRGNCCLPGETCDPVFGCAPICGENEARCENADGMYVSCCGEGTVCDAGMCQKDCKGGVRCNGICCLPGDVCEDNACKIPCDAATHARCGADESLCCDNASQICISQKCVQKGKPCTKSAQCNFDEVCEESSQSCINADEIVSSCEVRPQFGEFTPLLQFNWPKCLNGGAPSQYPDYTRVIVMPMAANMTDDNGDGIVDENDVPDIIFISYRNSYNPDFQAPSVLRVISGDDGHEIASSAPRYWTYPIDAAVADIDNDGKIEILAGTNNHRKYSDTIDWSTDEQDKIEALGVEPDAESPTGYKLVTKYQIGIGNGQKVSFISVADLDGDGTPEVITNYGIASVENGAFAWRSGCENKSLGYLHAADLDGDGTMELTNGSSIYDDHCNVLATGGSGGHIAIADLMPTGADPAQTGELIPEIAHTISKKYVSKTDGGKFIFSKIYKTPQEDGSFKWSIKKVWENPIPVDEARMKARGCTSPESTGSACVSGGGTPVIADFNGDGFPDVGVAARYYYIVYSNDGTPEGGRVLWADGNTQDYSSAVTGSSVFDFEGDGKAEVIYADEMLLRIYAGEGAGEDLDGDGYNDPKIIWKTKNRSATGYEYPIAVDADNDGSTEIVLSSDIIESADITTVGINVYEDPGAQWVRTRRIWNQHFYHVTNINEDGTVPQREQPNWLHPKLNNYRQNVQPAGVFNAPNLVAESISSDTSACAGDSPTATLSARVSNQGALGVKAGVSVKFYAADVNGTGTDAFLGEAFIPTTLPPGQSGVASLAWDQKVTIGGAETKVKTPAQIYFVVDEPTEEKKYGAFVECIEDDNAIAATQVELCPEKVN